jgi:hypothetical protein
LPRGEFKRRLAATSESATFNMWFEDHLDEPDLTALPRFQRFVVVLECVGHKKVERALATFEASGWEWPGSSDEVTKITFTPPLPADA